VPISYLKLVVQDGGTLVLHDFVSSRLERGSKPRFAFVPRSRKQVEGGRDPSPRTLELHSPVHVRP
jgi:hypothetical protein